MTAGTAVASESASAALGGAAGGPVRADIPGHVRVTPRAYERLLVAASSRSMGVGPRNVSVSVADESGRLVVHVTGAVSGEGASVLERISQVRRDVAEQAERLTGAAVTRVTVHITRIVFDDRRAR
jgi:uncharacterized alkaline shock family protein YloU